MPRNGAGVYTLPAGNPVVSGTDITDTWGNTTMEDIRDALTASLAKDGQTTPTANLPLGGFKLTGSGAASAAADVPKYSQVQDGAGIKVVTPAGTNTITGTLVPPITAYATGLLISLVPANTNTGATTIDLTTPSSAKNVFCNGAACAGGELRASIPVLLYYDGTQFNIIGANSFADSSALVHGGTDVTKKLRIEVDGFTTGNTRVATPPNQNFAIAGTDVVQTYSAAQRGGVTALTSSGASIAIDLAATNNFSHTLTENTTLASPSNAVAGQSGVITLTQHASSPKTLAYNAFWKFAGGSVPVLTATNSAVDVFAYYIESASRATCQLIKDVK